MKRIVLIFIIFLAGWQFATSQNVTVSGLKVQSEILNTSGETAIFTRKNLPAGIYLMKIQGNKQSETVKLIIQSL
jgi:hypothetical protein